jgi:hypothetical protein
MAAMATPTILTYDEHPFGLSWVLDEPMQRSSHALVVEGRVWLVDPVDVPEALDRVRALGEPAGVVQLLDRHDRAGAELASRLGVPHLRLPDTVPGSPFEVVNVVDVPKWRERALWWPAERVLVVAEAVGTGPMFRTDAAAAGIHLFLRLRPPGVLKAYEPEHLLMGHGAGVHGSAARAALQEAYARSLRDLPRVVARLPSVMR